MTIKIDNNMNEFISSIVSDNINNILLIKKIIII